MIQLGDNRLCSLVLVTRVQHNQSKGKAIKPGFETPRNDAQKAGLGEESMPFHCGRPGRHVQVEAVLQFIRMLLGLRSLLLRGLRLPEGQEQGRSEEGRPPASPPGHGQPISQTPREHSYTREQQSPVLAPRAPHLL